MLILSLRTLRAPPALHPHTTQRSNAAGAARKGPCPRGQKRPCTLWERKRGKLEMGSAPPWVHFLTISCTSPSHPHHIPIASPSSASASASLPADIRATHTPRHLPPPPACEQVRLGQLSTLESLGSARLLGLGTPCPLASPPCAPVPHAHRPPHTPHSLLRRGPTFPWSCHSTTEW